MLANKILHIILGILGVFVIPVQMVTTFVLGLLISIPIVGELLLTIISFIWIIFFYGPLLVLSYLYERSPILRPLISLVGVPLAIIGDIYVTLMPSMGEWESRWIKMIYCQTFPFTYEFHRISTKKEQNVSQNMYEIFERLAPELRDYAFHLINTNHSESEQTD